MVKQIEVNARAIHKLEDGKRYTLQEIVDLASVKNSTVYLAITSGELPHEKIEIVEGGEKFYYSILGEDARAWLLGKTRKEVALAGTTEHKVYEFMLSYQTRHGKPPIINEISTAVAMSPAYVKRALGILQDKGYVRELVPGAFFEAIPDEQRHRPNPLLGETDGARCRCGVALVWPQHITPDAVAALAERATVVYPRTWEEAVSRAQDLVRDMLTSDGVHCALCARGV